jgi:hypothetical protein
MHACAVPEAKIHNVKLEKQLVHHDWYSFWLLELMLRHG